MGMKLGSHKIIHNKTSSYPFQNYFTVAHLIVYLVMQTPVDSVITTELYHRSGKQLF